jgi:hypothetical protein
MNADHSGTLRLVLCRGDNRQARPAVGQSSGHIRSPHKRGVDGHSIDEHTTGFNAGLANTVPAIADWRLVDGIEQGTAIPSGKSDRSWLLAAHGNYPEGVVVGGQATCRFSSPPGRLQQILAGLWPEESDGTRTDNPESWTWGYQSPTGRFVVVNIVAVVDPVPDISEVRNSSVEIQIDLD